MPSSTAVTIQVWKDRTLLRTVTLSQDVIKIGKLSSSHLQLEDESVSRMHAVLEISPAREVSVVDLGSTKGTFVNGQRVTKSKVRPGDEVRIGDVRLVISLAAAEAEAPPEDATVQMSSGDMPQKQTGPRPTAMGVPALPSPPSAPPVAPTQAAPVTPPAPAAVAPIPAPPPFAAATAAPFAAPPPFAVPPPFPTGRGAAPPAPVIPPHIAEQVEQRDGYAIEVSALFEDAVLCVRHLENPQGGQLSSTTKGLLGAAVASLLGLFILFLVSYVQVSRLKAAKEAWEKQGKPAAEFVGPPREGAGRDVAAAVLLIIGVGTLLAGLYRMQGERTDSQFTIGPEAGATFPAPGDGLPRPLFPLVRSTGTDFELLFTHVMSGDMQHNGQTATLKELMDSGKARPSQAVSGAWAMAIPQGARFNLRYGEVTYNVNSVPRPRRYPVPIGIDWSAHSYTGGVFAAAALFLLLIFSVPPDPKSLSLDAFLNDQRLAKFLIKPEDQKQEEIPDWLKKNQEENSGGKRHKDEVGKMGKKDSKNQKNLFAIKGPKDNVDIKLAKDMARDAALKAGVLGLLKGSNNAALSSIFAKDSALGRDAQDALGGLLGTEVGDAYGGGGFGLVGTGQGGGGTGDATVGLGNLGTIGRGSGLPGGGSYGARAGALKGRRAGAPEVVPGTAEVRGSLDKELIRRIIRRHINEVKFCYEKELTRNPNLQGRVMINFTIGGTGAVIASVVQSSTMGNPTVEQCIAGAVRRWEFPRPQGGIVVVTYPFVLKSAGE